MPHRTDRWNNLMRQFSEQGITDYKIWEGIKHPDISIIGISESHKQIVRHAQTNGLQEVLIMEDDVCFCDKGAFDYFLSTKPTDFDIYLSSVYHGHTDIDNVIDDFCGLHCYIVHERFYDTFLNTKVQFAGNAFVHFDRALANKGKYVVCDPFVCYQMDGFSDNKNQMATYGHLMKHRKFFKNPTL